MIAGERISILITVLFLLFSVTADAVFYAQKLPEWITTVNESPKYIIVFAYTRALLMVSGVLLKDLPGDMKIIR